MKHLRQLPPRPWRSWGFLLFALAAAMVLLARPATAQITQGGVPELPQTPFPETSGPYGQAPSPTDFRERAIISAERGVLFEESQIGYGQGRTVVEYNEFVLEADYMVIDFTSGDIIAEGNVVFRSPNEFIKATRGRFNLTRAEGVAYGVDGQSEDIYFRSVWDEDEKGPSFRQIDEKQSIFRGTYFTTSSFPVPQYYILADEVIYIKGERVFFRNPVLWVRGVPMFWLPFYTRNLAEGSPWSQEFGFNTDLGFYFRLGYRYIHRVKTPSWENPEVYETRSHGLLDTYLDLMSQRGIGLGAKYRYQFDYYRHTGYLEVYGLRDNVRDVDGEEAGNEVRWVYRHKHYSRLADDWIFQWDADEASDPDVYVDVIDWFAADQLLERGRLYEQRMRAAITYRRNDYIARISAEQRERMSRDIYTDHSDPNSDDLDFDPDPDFTDEDEFDDNGFSSSRYATVSQNIYGRYATRLLNLRSAPLYYRFEANAFDSLDAGLNRLSTSDDTRVRGGDLYGSATHRLRLGERTTWMNTLGAGTAFYYRESDQLVTNEDFAAASGSTLPDGSRRVRGVRARNTETIVLGDGPTERDMSEVDPFYLFADYESRLNHRFTDYLEGFIRYRVREGTDDSLGEFYESMGMAEAAEDIYPFYSDYHYLEAALFYYLRYPNLFMGLYGRENLQSGQDIFPNEELRSIGYFLTYANMTREFQAKFNIGYSERQIRDRADPRAYEQGSIGGDLNLSYLPRHARYWARLIISGDHKLDKDPVDRDDRAKRRFDEDDTEFTIAPTIGRQFGPKYRLQLTGDYNTRDEHFRTLGLVILRDMADAELGLFLGLRNNATEARRNDDDDDEDGGDTREAAYEYDIRATLRFKINRDQPGLGQRSITTLSDLRREAEYVQ